MTRQYESSNPLALESSSGLELDLNHDTLLSIPDNDSLSNNLLDNTKSKKKKSRKSNKREESLSPTTYSLNSYDQFERSSLAEDPYLNCDSSLHGDPYVGSPSSLFAGNHYPEDDNFLTSCDPKCGISDSNYPNDLDLQAPCSNDLYGYEDQSLSRRSPYDSYSLNNNQYNLEDYDSNQLEAPSFNKDRFSMYQSSVSYGSSGYDLQHCSPSQYTGASATKPAKVDGKKKSSKGKSAFGALRKKLGMGDCDSLDLGMSKLVL